MTDTSENKNADAHGSPPPLPRKKENLPNAASVQSYLTGAQNGNPEAQYNLAYCLENGIGLPKNKKQAAHWYSKAAKQGHIQSQCALAKMYYLGEGVEQYKTQSVYWYRKAAEQGDAKAQCNLAGMLANGEGVPKDTDQAIEWFRKSAAQGNEYAIEALSRLEDENISPPPLVQSSPPPLPDAHLLKLRGFRHFLLGSFGIIYIYLFIYAIHALNQPQSLSNSPFQIHVSMEKFISFMEFGGTDLPLGMAILSLSLQSIFLLYIVCKYLKSTDWTRWNCAIPTGTATPLQYQLDSQSVSNVRRVEYFLAWSLVLISIHLFFTSIHDVVPESDRGTDLSLGMAISSVSLQTIFIFYTVFKRLQNIGWSGWYCFFGFIPCISFFFWFLLQVLPPNYGNTKKLDGWAWAWIVLLILSVSLIVLLILLHSTKLAP